MMHLKIRLPAEVFIDKKVKKITAEALNGEFCLLPRHIDFATVLASGILSYEDDAGTLSYVAVDGGVLVKIKQEVWISTPHAVTDAPLGSLEKTVEEKFNQLERQEKKATSAASKIEAGIIRKFLDTQAI